MNRTLGQRIGRGKAVGFRTSVSLPDDTLDLINEAALRHAQTASAIIVQALEIGVRELAAKGFPSKGGHLTQDEIDSLFHHLK